MKLYGGNNLLMFGNVQSQQPFEREQELQEPETTQAQAVKPFEALESASELTTPVSTDVTEVEQQAHVQTEETASDTFADKIKHQLRKLGIGLSKEERLANFREKLAAEEQKKIDRKAAQEQAEAQRAEENRPKVEALKKKIPLVKQRMDAYHKATKFAYSIEIREGFEGPFIRVYSNAKDYKKVWDLVKDIDGVSTAHTLPQAAKAKAENLVDQFSRYPVRDGQVEDLATFDVTIEGEISEYGNSDNQLAIITVTPKTNRWSTITSILSYAHIDGAVKPGTQFNNDSGRMELKPFELVIDNEGNVSQRGKSVETTVVGEGDEQEVSVEEREHLFSLRSTYR